MEKRRQDKSRERGLDSLAALARREAPPDIDVVPGVLRALGAQTEPATDRPLAWIAALAGAGAMAAAVSSFTLLEAMAEPFAPLFQIGTMMEL
jgi:hypothetical protein